MDKTYTTLGTLALDGSIQLDKPLDLPPGRIELTVRLLSEKSDHSIWDLFPHCPEKRPKREIDVYVRSLREEWRP